MPAEAKQAGGSSTNVQQMSLDQNENFNDEKNDKNSTNFDRKHFLV